MLEKYAKEDAKSLINYLGVEYAQSIALYSIAYSLKRIADAWGKENDV